MKCILSRDVLNERSKAVMAAKLSSTDICLMVSFQLNGKLGTCFSPGVRVAFVSANGKCVYET